MFIVSRVFYAKGATIFSGALISGVPAFESTAKFSPRSTTPQQRTTTRRRCRCAFVHDAQRDSRHVRLSQYFCSVHGVELRQLLVFLNHCPIRLYRTTGHNLNSLVDHADRRRLSNRFLKHHLQKSHSILPSRVQPIDPYFHYSEQ